MSSKLRHQFSRFFLGGLVAVSLDWGAFFLLTRFGEIESIPSKFISFIIGTIFAFCYNGAISFQSNLGVKQFIRHIILYTSSMFVNVVVFDLSMKEAPEFLGSATFISLALATSISMFLNFFGMRSWVFRVKEFYND
jgi:putative flippase GtrA